MSATTRASLPRAKAPAQSRTVLPPARRFADDGKTKGTTLSRRGGPPARGNVHERFKLDDSYRRQAPAPSDASHIESSVVNEPTKRTLTVTENPAVSGAVIRFVQPDTDVPPPVITLGRPASEVVNDFLFKKLTSTTITTSGSPLPVAVKNPLMRSFSIDLSPIRVHTDARAQQTVKSFNTRAFAYGSHIFLGPGESPSDLRLMAHEVAHVVQQSGGAVLQHFTVNRDDTLEEEAEKASEAAMRGEKFTVKQRTTPRPQGLLGIDISIPDPLEWIANKANSIPGFRMLTIVLGVNPINMSSVDRSAANILRALIEFLPGGSLISEALDNHGVFEKAGTFVETQIKSLGMTASVIKSAVTEFISGLNLPGDLLNPGSTWERAKRIFTAPIDQIISFASGLVSGIIEIVKDAILKPIAKLAEGTEGYNLLKGVLGKDPITGDPVDRSAETLLGPLLRMIGLGDVWQKMEQSKAIPRAWQWFQSTLSQLIGFVSEIPTLFLNAFKSLTIEDIILVPKAFAKLAAVFGGFMSKFVSWGIDAMWTLLEIVFDVVSPGALGYVKRTGAAMKSILQNPLPFVGNLARAAKLGFQNFGANFVTHLKKGLIDWLTGSLQGVYIPKALSLVEFGKLALSVLGITWAQIRAKIVKALGPNGETIMKGLEVAFDVIKALVTGGPAAAWEIIKDKLSSLKDQIVSGIISFVVEAVVTKAIPKLIAMFIPGAGFISAIISIYDMIMVFVNKISKIIQVVTAFLNSIAAIAAGNIGAAAGKVESILGGLLSLAISFLAGFAGLGKVADKVMGVVNKIRATVDKALDTAINFIIGKAKALFASLFGGKDKKPDARSEAQKMADLRKAVAESQPIVSDKSSSKRKKQKNLNKIKSKYQLSNIELITDSKSKDKETVHVRATINPTYDSAGMIIAAFPPQPTVVIEAIVGAPIPRQGMEEVLPTRAGYERAHLLGPILGHDLPQGVFYAPSEVNQTLQKSGIEHMIKAMHAQRYPGAEFKVTLTAQPHAGGDFLASARYVLHGRFPGEDWTFIFDYTIKVGAGASPRITVKAGEAADMDAVHRFSAGAQSVMTTRGV